LALGPRELIMGFFFVALPVLGILFGLILLGYMVSELRSVLRLDLDGGYLGIRDRLWNRAQRVCVAVGLAVTLVAILFPVWKPAGSSPDEHFEPELGRSLVLDPPVPQAEVHLTRVWWDIAIAVVATAGSMWIAVPRESDQRSLLANMRVRRSIIAAVVGFCMPLPFLPIPMWVAIVLVGASGGAGSHHAGGVPAAVLVLVTLLMGFLYSAFWYGLLSAVLRLAVHRNRE
jgi:hypothetical protein